MMNMANDLFFRHFSIGFFLEIKAQHRALSKAISNKDLNGKILLSDVSL